MSWLFSQALVAEYSAGTSLDSAPCALSSGTPTPQASWLPDKTTAVCRLSRSGMTFKPLTVEDGEAVLMSFRAAFPARIFQRPEKGPESTASAAECGGIWPESFARWSPDSSSWKTPQCSLLAGLDEFSETWPRWGMMRAGECLVQSMPVLRTSENGSGLLPTPLASIGTNGGPNQRDSSGRPGLQMAAMNWPTPSAYKQTASGDLINADGTEWDGVSKLHSKKTGKPVQTALLDKVRNWPTPHGFSKDGKSNGPSGNELGRAVNRSMWPTPTMGDYRSERPTFDPSSSQQSERSLATAARHWPTPTVHDSKNNGAASQMEQNTKPLNAEIGGSLNPTWVEWLMGWPIGWTDLNVSAMDKFRQWCRSHGRGL